MFSIMPPKKNTTQKQKQKKAKQQQQQQQNVKVNIKIGDKAQRARQPRKQSVKRPTTQPVQAPIIQQAPYIPMFLSQQPAQYFTPPVSAPTLPVSAPTTPATIPMSAPRSSVVSTATQVEEPSTEAVSIPTDYFGTFTNLASSALRGIGDFAYSATESPSVFPNVLPRPSIPPRTFEFGTQTEDIYPQVPTISRSTPAQPIELYFEEPKVEARRRTMPFNPPPTRAVAPPTTFEFGTQTEDNTPSAISATLRNMETQTQKFIPQPPPLPLPKEVIERISPPKQVALTEESLKQLNQLRDASVAKNYAPSEVSDVTDISTMTGLTEINNAMLLNALENIKRQTQEKSDIEETLKKQKEEKKKELGGAYGQMAKEMEKRRQFIQPPEEPEEENDDWEENFSNVIVPKKPEISIQPPQEKEDDELAFEDVKEKKKSEEDDDKELEFEIQEKRKPVEEKQKIRKKGSGRPKGSGNKSDLEREADEEIKKEKANIKEFKAGIREIKKSGMFVDKDGYSAEDYEQEIEDAQSRIEYFQSVIEDEKEKRKLQTIQEEDESEPNIKLQDF